MEHASKSQARRLTFALTKKIASLLVPLGFSFGEFLGAAKSAFVAAAEEHVRDRGKRVSTARIAILTGLTRAEVARLRDSSKSPPETKSEQRTERVMHGWFTDPRYVDDLGSPRPLPMTGTHSFDELVRRYSGDVPRRAVLDELVSGGMAATDTKASIRALRRHHAAPTNIDIDIERLGKDLDIFFASADRFSKESRGELRRLTVQFPGNIPSSVRRTVTIRTERFLEALADYLHAEATSALQPPATNTGSKQSISILLSQCHLNEAE